MPQVPVNSTPNAKPAPAKPIAPISNRPLLVPPEEQFWKRYSPHNEFSLSGATSIAVHIIGLGLLLLLAWLFFKPVEGKTDVPDMDMVAVAPSADEAVYGKSGGGGGEGGTDPQLPKEAVGPDEKTDETPSTNGSTTGTELADPKESGPVEVGSSNEGTRTINTSSAPSDLDNIISKRAYVALAERKSKGKKSSGRDGGTGGGKDKGTDKGEGRGYGDGKNGDPEVRRAKRQLRWHLTLNTLEGESYLDQLYALGAIIVVPEPRPGPNGKPLRDANGQFLLRYRLVIRDLTRKPAKPEIEDVRKLDGMFWIDDNPEQVRRLASQLGVRPPILFANFFPDRVEPDMRKLERAKYTGPENKITSTEFKLIDDKNGPYKGKLGNYRLVCTNVAHS